MRSERIGGCQAETRLAQALVAAARGERLAATVSDHRSRAWASATFVGARHTLALVAPRARALGDWIAALPEQEFELRGHLVADLAIERIEDDGEIVAVTLAVLTIESDAAETG